MVEKTVNVERLEQMTDIFGAFDENIGILERELGVTVLNRNTEFKFIHVCSNFFCKFIIDFLDLIAYSFWIILNPLVIFFYIHFLFLYKIIKVIIYFICIFFYHFS